MTYYSVSKPYELFFDSNGGPLEDGYIYIGEVNQNPITNPITVYWDVNGLYPAAQPIRTLSGYPSRNGSPSMIFIDSADNLSYSILIQDKNNELVYSSIDAVSEGYAAAGSVDSISDLRAVKGFNNPVYVRGHTDIGDGGEGHFEFIGGAAAGTYTDDNGITIIPSAGDGSGAWIRQDIKGEVFVDWFNGTGDGVTNDYTAIQAAMDYAREHSMGVAFNEGVYLSETTVFAGETIANRSRRGIKYIRGAGMKLTTLLGASAGNPVLDMTGSRWYSIKDIAIEGDTSSIPNVGYLAARLDYDTGTGDAPSVGECELHRVEITGEFSIAALYTYGSEEQFFNECIFRNERTAGESTIYITDTNETHSIASVGTTIAGTTTNAQQSNIGHYFNNCMVFDYTAVNAPESAIYLKAGKTFKFENCFIYLGNTGKIDPYMFNLDQETSSGLIADIKIIDNYFEQLSSNDTEVYIGAKVTGIQYLRNRGSGAGILAAAGAQIVSQYYPNIIECDTIDFSAAGCDMLGYNNIYIRAAFSIDDYFNGDIYTDHEVTPTITIADPTHFLGNFHRNMGVIAYAAGPQLIPNNDVTALTLDTEEIDLDANFSANIFTAPVPGNYQVVCQVTFASMADLSEIRLYIYLNTGSGFAEYTRHYIVTSGTIRHSILINRNIRMMNSHAVRFYVYQNSGGAVNIIGGNNYTFTTIKLD
jgi:hypothetical protein